MIVIICLAREYLYGEYSPHGTNFLAHIINFHCIITVKIGLIVVEATL